MINSTKLYLVRNNHEAALAAVALFTMRGLPAPPAPDALVAIMTADGHLVAALGLKHLADSERLTWLATNPEQTLRLRHAAAASALKYALEVALSRGCDLTADVTLPWGVLGVLKRIAGKPRIERIARFAPTVSQLVEVIAPRRRRVSARASSEAPGPVDLQPTGRLPRASA